MVDQNGRIVNYAYNGLGHLTSLTDGGGKTIAAYSYDAAGRLSRKDLQSGAANTYSYTSAGLLSGVVTSVPGGATAYSSALAAASITVTPVNDPPSANPQSVTIGQVSSKTIQLTGDDGDPEVVQLLTYAIAKHPDHGTAAIVDPHIGQVIYTPEGHYHGPDSFTFTVIDDAQAGNTANLASPAATVSITVASTMSQTIGLYNPYAAHFYLADANSASPGVTQADFPSAGIPVRSYFKALVGDWNGDGTETLGFYDPYAADFYLLAGNSTDLDGMISIDFPACQSAG